MLVSHPQLLPVSLISHNIEDMNWPFVVKGCSPQKVGSPIFMTIYLEKKKDGTV